MANIKKHKLEEQIEKEVVFGIIPVLKKGRIYGFWDAFLVLSGYCIATWSYTQGVYLASLVGFRQLLIGAFIGAILMLVIYQLPVILATRYGIDIWIWLRTIFGTRGVTILAVIIIVINFPWYAVCADLFASSIINLAGIFGIVIPSSAHVFLAISCVLIGTALAYKGIGAIIWTTRILVPLLLAAGVMVIVIGFTSMPVSEIWNYTPDQSRFGNSIIPYIISVEANFAFVITLVGGMAGVPRLTKNEKGGYWAGILGQGFSGSLFVVVGAVMAIAMQYAVGIATDDPTTMIATLTIPALGLATLLLVAFANIGTQAVGSYIYGVMLKSTFKKTSYSTLILALAFYVSLLCIWGRIIQFFGQFLTISAYIYAPLAALLFVDFFFIRKQKISLRSAFSLKGFHSYHYSGGFNLVGFACMIGGIIASLAVYNPLTEQVHQMFLFHFTPTGFSFCVTGLLYFWVSKIPFIKSYLLEDRKEITI